MERDSTMTGFDPMDHPDESYRTCAECGGDSCFRRVPDAQVDRRDARSMIFPSETESGSGAASGHPRPVTSVTVISSHLVSLRELVDPLFHQLTICSTTKSLPVHVARFANEPSDQVPSRFIEVKKRLQIVN